jgi:acetyl-CoA carboxylase biotin carboxylase subunit
MLSGIDIVAEQIRLAAGEPLGYGQADVQLRGHAIEFRITAEDPRADFQPQVGTVTHYVPPGGAGVRMDSHLYSGYEVPPYYDSLLGKLIVWGPDRESAIARSRVALRELLVDGLITIIPFHRAVLEDPTFLAGGFDTNLLDRRGAAAFLDAVAVGQDA